MNLIKFLILLLSNQRGEVNFAGQGNTGAGAGEGGSGNSGAGEGAGAAGGTGDGGTGGEGGGNAGAGGDAGQGGMQINFPSGVTDDVKAAANTTFKNFINIDGVIDHASLMKSYLHNQSLLGSDKIVIPNSESSAEDWTAAHRKMGCPEDIQDFKLENTVSKGITANEKLLEGFVKVAHEAGLNPKQAQAILDFNNNFMGENLTQSDMDAKVAFDTDVAALKTEWGEGFDSKCQLAKKGLLNFCTEDEAKALQDQGILDSTLVTRLFAKIGQGLVGEGTFNDEGKGTFGMTPEDAQTAITKMYKDEAFTNSRHKDHDTAVAKFMRLNEMLHGTGEANQSVSFAANRR